MAQEEMVSEHAPLECRLKSVRFVQRRSCLCSEVAAAAVHLVPVED